MTSPRTICIVVASRANYGRIKTVMEAIRSHPLLKLQVIVGASALLVRYGRVIDIIQADGFNIDDIVHYVVEGETPQTQAKTTGLGVIELSTSFHRLMPDMVLTVADRYETMATAIAATYSGIPLVHVQGGEISGNIDDRVRHAITKLADLHFPCSAESATRIQRMGEDPAYIFHHGCPSIDIAASVDTSLSSDPLSAYKGTGDAIDWQQPYILLLQHPVTTSFGDGYKQISESLHSLKQFGDYQKIVLWPNIDAGSDDVAKGIRQFRESGEDAHQAFHYFRNFSPEDYIRVLANAACVVGNSSSFIREGAFLGIPAVIIGDRQIGRECGKNVIKSTHDRHAISQSISAQLQHGAYPRDLRFGDGHSAQHIAECLATVTLPPMKRMTY